MNWRLTKKESRAVVQDTMAFDAFAYINGAGNPVPVRCRLHTRSENVGDLAGTSLAYAEVRDETPKLIFWADDGHTPARNNVYAIEGEGAFRVDTVDPADGPTITAICKPVNPSEAASFPSPTLVG